ncbi:oxidoreductase [Streptomyces albipurpureus]|uniref:Oxidoreductase n=1 Tax=Streptomyces albipurpureus TaxID=2897419 RepID=A0ABT0UF77_9ACTN|nr:oxidoreductase [Streptomyces sp. CWNU-1]MCM2386792.1 oxidoreductase [Streptomyces sp. CWNU-1]
MSAEYTTFGLAPAMRAGGVLASGVFKTHRDFMDFIVDGQPLLFQLSDLDAVSPLASDVPPAIFTAEVRTLLLEAPAPLADGRCVIYACPECADLGCGAVTAVIERDGADIVWRDFAWQTSEQADLEREGYEGIGPFRFRGDVYRAELERLIAATTTDATAGPARPQRGRVLLIGARASVLRKLAAALRTIGVGADISRDAAQVPAEELRTYGAVAFGRAVPDEERAAVREAFTAAGADAAFVDGLAPVIPVLLAQIEDALHRGPRELRRLVALTAADGEAWVTVTSSCEVSVRAYRLDRIFRTHEREVFAGLLEAGEHRIPLSPGAVRGPAFLVARTVDGVLVTQVPR